MISEEERAEEKRQLESKISNLCNDFVSCRNIHIRDIAVNYGQSTKGWFPHNAINVDVITYSVLEIPCGDCKDRDMEPLDRIYRKKGEEE